jgi:hypothetical protein
MTRQLQAKKRISSIQFRPHHARENSQVLGLALTLHHDNRNKVMMDFLSAHDYCVLYGHTLLIETALANAVV